MRCGRRHVKGSLEIACDVVCLQEEVEALGRVSSPTPSLGERRLTQLNRFLKISDVGVCALSSPGKRLREAKHQCA